MTDPEFSCPIDVRHADGAQMHLSANEKQRAALAKRFELVRIDRLQAEISLACEGPIVSATGRMEAQFVQSCAVSAEELAASANEAIDLRFVPSMMDTKAEEEIELEAEDLDEIEYDGQSIDLGEAVAQTLALAIDPFATGPQADQARSLFKKASESPFSALASLKLPPDTQSGD